VHSSISVCFIDVYSIFGINNFVFRMRVFAIVILFLMRSIFVATANPPDISAPTWSGGGDGSSEGGCVPEKFALYKQLE
jgi:hypothetical protein